VLIDVKTNPKNGGEKNTELAVKNMVTLRRGGGVWVTLCGEAG